MKDMIASRYQIIRQIGQGGMADVFLANDTLLNREVAIKVLRGDLSNDAVSLLRFQREAQAASRLNHPNIVEIYDVGNDGDKQFIVMEYVKGKTLKQLISSRGALYKEEAVSIMIQLTSAINEAHINGIIHRDIKPQNVLVKDDGTVKMSDFGIALAQDAIQLTQTDSVVGSVHYLAPELARGEKATYQSDIYALGIVFYELLVGDVPHHADAPVQVALKHMREDIESILKFNPSLPQTLDNIVSKATVKNTAHRYLNTDDLLKDLKTCLDSNRANEKKIEFDVLNDNETILIERISKVDPKKDKKSRGYSSSIGVGLIAIAIIAMIVIFMLMSGTLDGVNKTVIPDITGLSVSDAVSLLEEHDLEVDSRYTYVLTDDIEEGELVGVSPEIGTEVEKGYVVELTVSSGMYFVVDNYVGKNIDDVEKLLADERIRIRIEYEQSDIMEAGEIIRQEIQAPGTKLDPNRLVEIKFVVSAETEFVIPLNIVGMNVEEAKRVLEELGGEVALYPMSTEGLSEEELEKIERNVVIQVNPAGGSIYVQRDGVMITLYYY